MKIIFDSTVLYDHWLLEGAEIELLLRFARESGARLVVPELVIRETVKNYREKLENAIQQIKDSQRALKNLQRGEIRPMDEAIQECVAATNPVAALDGITASFEASLSGRLLTLGASIPTLGAVPHERTLARSLKRRRPFNSSGGGYQDALLWETILTQIDAADLTVFLCNNPRDFSRDRREHAEEFHDDLKADIAEKAVGENAIQLCSSIVRFNERYSHPMLEELEAASAAQKRREKEVKAWSRRWMKSDWEKSEEEIRTLLNVKAKSFLQQDNVLSMMEDPQIVYIEKPYHYEVEEVSELDSERIYVNLAVKAELNIEGFLFKSDYYLLDDKSPFSIWDDDWNKHYMFVSTEVKAILVLSFILKSKTKDVDQIEAEFAESFGWCRHCGNRS